MKKYKAAQSYKLKLRLVALFLQSGVFKLYFVIRVSSMCLHYVAEELWADFLLNWDSQSII